MNTTGDVLDPVATLSALPRRLRLLIKFLLVTFLAVVAYLLLSLLGQQGSAHAATSPGLLGGVTPVLDSVAAPVTTAIAPVTTPITTAVAPGTNAIAPGPAPAAAVTTPLTTAVAPIVDTIAAPITTAVAPILTAMTTPVAGVISPITSGLAPVLTTVTAPVAAVLAPLADTVAAAAAPVDRVLDSPPPAFDLAPTTPTAPTAPASGPTPAVADPGITVAAGPASVRFDSIAAALMKTPIPYPAASSTAALQPPADPDAPGTPVAPDNGSGTGGSVPSTSSASGGSGPALAVVPGNRYDGTGLRSWRVRSGDARVLLRRAALVHERPG
jgi:hypothetical protein